MSLRGVWSLVFFKNPAAIVKKRQYYWNVECHERHQSAPAGVHTYFFSRFGKKCIQRYGTPQLWTSVTNKTRNKYAFEETSRSKVNFVSYLVHVLVPRNTRWISIFHDISCFSWRGPPLFNIYDQMVPIAHYPARRFGIYGIKAFSKPLSTVRVTSN